MRHVLCAALVTLIVAPASAQTASSAPAPAKAPVPKTWTAPRTPEGQPDLQGIWLNNGATPLERPKQLEGKPTLTDEEIAELKQRAARIFDDGNNSDFAGGDGFFLALLANPDRYRNPGSTGGADTAMIERVFDNRTSLISDPADGRIPAMTAEGRARLAKAPTPTGAGQRPIGGPEDFSLPLRCISYGIPRLGTTNIAGAGPLGYYQIVQTPGYVVLFLEAIHETRIIPLTARSHLPEGLRQVSGDSRGHWEGQTLVVDTTNFSGLGNFMGSAEGLHLVEHFTRVANDTLDYQITISDPSTWTKPWTVLIHLKQRDEPIYEYACHEGNYDVMRGMLLGAQVQK
jgi:hypothetical protein